MPNTKSNDSLIEKHTCVLTCFRINLFLLFEYLYFEYKINHISNFRNKKRKKPLRPMNCVILIQMSELYVYKKN